MTSSFAQFVYCVLQESLLVEKSRYERETGNDFNQELREKIKSLVSDTHPAPYAFTMIKIPKIGLNPGTSYETPAGVYFYPLTPEYCQKLIDNRLPFVSDNPYFGIVKLKHLDEPDKWLKFIQTRISHASINLLSSFTKKFPKAAEKMNLSGKHKNFSRDAQIFDITYFESQKATGKSTSAWNKILRNHGIVGIYDAGNKIIHPSEPTQLVCLSPEAYETVGIWATKELRREKFDISQMSNVSKDKKLEILKRKSVSAKMLHMLSKDANIEVRSAIAKNPDCPAETLNILSKDPEFDVRLSVAQNPNCPIAILNILSTDSDNSIKKFVMKRLAKKNKK